MKRSVAFHKQGNTTAKDRVTRARLSIALHELFIAPSKLSIALRKRGSACAELSFALVKLFIASVSLFIALSKLSIRGAEQ